MVEINKDDLDDKKSPKQEAFIFRLLNSSVFSKKEFEQIFRLVLPNIITSEDANLLINYLTSAIAYKKPFLPKRCRARKKCSACGEKTDVKRYYNKIQKEQIMLCKDCDKYNNLDLFEPNSVVEKREESIKLCQQEHAEHQKAVKKFEEYVDTTPNLSAKQEDDMLETARETIEE